jgi:hypothetical protein
MRRNKTCILFLFLGLFIIFTDYQNSYAQRRQVAPQDWIPFIQQEREPATPVKKAGILWMDPNGTLSFKNYRDILYRLAGTNITYNDIYEFSIDGNVVYVDGTNHTVGFFTNTPSPDAYIQLSDDFVICKTKTSAGVQACIDILGSDGGEVYFIDGNYDMSSLVTATCDSLILRGAGAGTKFIQSGNHKMFYFNGVDNLSISDILFDGSDANITDDYLVHIYGGEINANCNNCVFKEIGNCGLIFETTGNSSYMTVDNCLFEDSNDIPKSRAIVTDDTMVISNCDFKNLRNAIYVSANSVGTQINNCNFYNCHDTTYYGIYILGDKTIVDNCNFKYGDTYLYLNGSDYTRITNNIIYAYMIYSNSSSHLEISHNVITASWGDYALYISGSLDSNITDNDFALDGIYVIYMSGGTYNVISNNKLHGNGGTDDTDASIAIYLTNNVVNTTIANNTSYWLQYYFLEMSSDCVDIFQYNNTMQTYTSNVIGSIDSFGPIKFDSPYTLRALYTKGGYTTKYAEAAANILGDTNTVIQVNIPSGSKILGCQLRVDSQMTAGDLWDAKYTGGATQIIATAQAVTINTKVSTFFDENAATAIISSEADIVITKNGGGNFTGGGQIRAVIYYQTFETMGSL